MPLMSLTKQAPQKEKLIDGGKKGKQKEGKRGGKKGTGQQGGRREGGQEGGGKGVSDWTTVIDDLYKGDE